MKGAFVIVDDVESCIGQGMTGSHQYSYPVASQAYGFEFSPKDNSVQTEFHTSRGCPSIRQTVKKLTFSPAVRAEMVAEFYAMTPVWAS